MAEQLSLFNAVREVYAASGGDEVPNRALYRQTARRAGIPETAFQQKAPIGKSGQLHSPQARGARWAQQTLKMQGLLESVQGKRGVWRLTREGKQTLCRINRGYSLLAFSTKLGVALWGDCRDIFAHLDEPITLCLSSPPYPLARSRAYGNPSGSEYVDFICQALEPIVRHLKDGGSIVLNISNDIFEKGSPARSLYRERLVLALHDRLGLFKMDELIWHNPSKPPGPVQWASIKRMQLNVAYEPVYWFTNNPACVDADNRRVLIPHTDQHRKLMAQGGEQREQVFSDGAYRINPGDFGRETSGRISRNVLMFGHACGDQRRYKAAVRTLGLPAHGAPYPLRLAEFLVNFLSSENDLIVDPFAGSMTTAKAAENHHRRWLCTEVMREYARGGAERLREASGFWLNPALETALD